MSRWRSKIVCGSLIVLAGLTGLAGAPVIAAEALVSKVDQPRLPGAHGPVAAKLTREPIAPISKRFAPADVSETPSFRRHVVPLLGKLGCNGRACHGSFQGRGGFRLSLFGYDFKADHEALLAGDDEPRVDPKDPDASLILQKPTLRIPHEGGERYKLGSWEHHVLLRWIQGGAIGTKDSDPTFVRLEVRPAEIRFAKKDEHAVLKAVAHWSDGTSEDVTPLCRFQSNDEQVAKIDAVGAVTSVDAGDSHVVVFYDAGVVPVSVVRPVSDVVGPRYPEVPTPTTVDRLVVNKLRKLGIVPSDLCSDADFLRRVSLDLTGTLPTAKEAAAFLADKTPPPHKRRRKIDELLERPTYAAWWTTRLCDFTGNNDGALNNITPVNQQASQEWYDWVLKRVRANVPYDKLVEGIVLASSRPANQSYGDYSEEMTALYRKNSHGSYADRPGLTHFWARRTIVQPQQKALSFAYTFLGIRIQCAECHKHPFDQWTQQDYKDFTKFFAPIRFGIDPADRTQYEALLASLGVDQKKKGGDLRREYPRLLAEGKTLPFDEVFVVPPAARGPVRAQRPRPHRPDAKPGADKRSPKVAASATNRKPIAAQRPRPASAVSKVATNKQGITDKKLAAVMVVAAADQKSRADKKPATSAPANKTVARKAVIAQRPMKQRPVVRKPARPAEDVRHARLLGAADSVDLAGYDDPRLPLMRWLRSKDNRFFARAFVNRVWASYFNVGIVNPPDDLSLANPPSNAELLDYLANGFVEHHYDMKWLHREILGSRTYQLTWRPNDTNRLDQHNFSHAVPRRLPAEVAFDAVRQATANDATVKKMLTDWRDRAIGVPGSGRRARGGSVYALNVFGRSVRQSNCDCDRSNEPSLLQTVFLRNDNEVLSLVGDSRNGWVAQIAAELFPRQQRPAAKPNRQKPAKGPTTAPQATQAAKAPKPTGAAVPRQARAAKPFTPEQKNRLIAQLAERVKRLEADGKTEQAKRVTARLDEVKRRPTVRAAGGGGGGAKNAVVAPVPPLKPVQLTAEKKSSLVRTAYLRALSRYPDKHEEDRALGYLNDANNVQGGLRDLLWALVNTQEFIVNH